MVIVLDCCFKEFRFDLHADSIELVDFLHVLGYLLNVNLFLHQMRLNKRLVSIAAITVLLTLYRMYFALVCLV